MLELSVILSQPSMEGHHVEPRSRCSLEQLEIINRSSFYHSYDVCFCVISPAYAIDALLQRGRQNDHVVLASHITAHDRG
jgi:hypothetical protein